ncbi:nucleotide sugar dehydrogenase [bacterium]|nr:nucleotide sugar dehydrogenase [bacterium]
MSAFKGMIKRIDDKTAKIVIVGIGYVGLPLAMSFSEDDFQVYGLDVRDETVENLKKGISHINDIPNERLKKSVDLGLFVPTTDKSIIADADAIFICVPTPFTKNKTPDVSYIEDASINIAKYLKKGHIVILESTTYPGTTVELVKPILEKSGLKAGTDFTLVFSPERVDPGNDEYSIENTPKVVGGITPEGTDIARRLYGAVVGKDNVVTVSSPTIAEMVKLLENTFRSVNIALIFELATLCHRMNINIWEVIDAAATKPFGFMPFYPGPGVGGHCIPVDPFYLAWKAREFDFSTKFIELAAETNIRMPDWIMGRIFDLLNRESKVVKNSKILVLGVTFKKNINDSRNSPSFRIMELLLHHGADISYSDPYVPEIIVGEWHDDYNPLLANPVGLKSCELTAEFLGKQDMVILIVDHDVFDYKLIVDQSQLIFDTKNATKRLGAKPGNVYLL